MLPETLQCQLFGWEVDKLLKRVNRKQENIMISLKNMNKVRMIQRIIKQLKCYLINRKIAGDFAPEWRGC